MYTIKVIDHFPLLPQYLIWDLISYFFIKIACDLIAISRYIQHTSDRSIDCMYIDSILGFGTPLSVQNAFRTLSEHFQNTFRMLRERPHILHVTNSEDRIFIYDSTIDLIYCVSSSSFRLEESWRKESSRLKHTSLFSITDTVELFLNDVCRITITRRRVIEDVQSASDLTSKVTRSS